MQPTIFGYDPSLGKKTWTKKLIQKSPWLKVLIKAGSWQFDFTALESFDQGIGQGPWPTAVATIQAADKSIGPKACPESLARSLDCKGLTNC